MASVDVKVDGLDEAVEEIDDRTARIKDLAPAWRAGAEALRAAVDERFETSTDFLGGPWAPLLPNTVLYRKPGKILVQDTTLRNANFATGDRNGIAFGNVLEYAAMQYFGEVSGDRNHPARPWFPVDPETGEVLDQPGTPAGELMDEIEATLMDYVEGETEGRGR